MEAQRFLDAQATAYDRAVAEVRRGRKESHWIWFVFPQLGALGRSGTAKFYGLEGLDDARDYLAHPTLGARLVEAVEAAVGSGERDPVALFGELDAMKFRSCLTLFEAAAEDPAPFAAALERFYGGERDRRTLELLGHA